MHVLDESLQEVDITVGNTASVLTMEEMMPSLETVQKRHVVALEKKCRRNTVGGETRMLCSQCGMS